MRSSFTVFRSVIFALVLREFLGRFFKRRMGAAWTIIEPFVHIFLLTLFFTYIRGTSIVGVEFPIFLITGLVPFFLYRNIATKMLDAIAANRGLFAYRQIKPLDTFYARTVVEGSIQVVVYLLLLLIFGWLGYDVSVHAPLEWIGMLLVGLVFAFSVGLLIAVFVSALPDARVVVSWIFFPLYFISGVIYPPSRFPAEYMPYLLWNPFLHILELARSFVFENYQTVPGVSILYVCEITLIFLFSGFGLYWVRRIKLLAL